MTRSFAKMALLAGVIGVSSFLAGSRARAGLLVTYSINGGATTTLCSGSSGSACAGSVTSGGINISLQTASSNSPGTTSLADLLSAVLSLSNTNTSGTGTVVLTIGDINFTGPTTPPNLDFHSQIGGSVPVGGASNFLSFVSSIDQGNGQNVSPGTINAATLTPSITSVGSYNDFNDTIVTSLTSPFSMTEVLDVTLTAGSIINYSASTTLAPAVPEPASLILFGSSLIGLGFFGRRKKRA